MARINLDDDFFADKRIKYLAALCGEPEIATRGRIIHLYWDSVSKCKDARSEVDIEIQAEWFNPERGPFAELMVKAQLAKKLEDGTFKIGGVEERMQWLLERKDSSSTGGQKSCKGRKRDEKGRLLSNVNPSELGGDLGKDPSANQANPSASNVLTLTLAPVLAPALIPVLKNKDKEEEIASVLENPEAGGQLAGVKADGASPTALTWRAYRDAYALKYGEPPTWNAKTAGLLKNFVSRIPAAEAPEVARFFVGHPGSYYGTNGHAVWLLLKDAEKLRTEWATGKRITGTTARQVEKQSGYQSQLEQIARGEL